MNLPERMKAVKAYAPYDYRIEEVERPKPNEDEIIIKVEACGICGSDLKAFKGSEYQWGSEGEKGVFETPVTPGHEFFGTVVEIGDRAREKKEVEIGDRITTDQIIPCGECKFCQKGEYWMCEVHNIYGFQKDVAEGAFAEFMKIEKESKIYQIPDSISTEGGALIEPLAVAMHAVERAEVEFRDFVVVAGVGTIGLSLIQLISLKNPKFLVALDINEKRLNTAEKLGADLSLNPIQEDITEKIKKMTEGYGCDIYLNATGSPQGVKQGLEMTRKLGTFVEMSVFGEETSVDWSIIGDQKELDVRGSHLGPYKYPVVIDLLDRNLITSNHYISEVYSIDDFHEALERAQDEDVIKVLIRPNK